MAEQTRNDAASGFLPELGIPSGLNRIRTRRARVSSGGEDSDQFNESPSSGVSISESDSKQKLNDLHRGRGKFYRAKEGFRKGRKIARWFSSSLFKDPDQALGNTSNTQSSASGLSMPDKWNNRRKQRKMQKNLSGDSPKVTSTDKVQKCLKSFSHELGPKGGLQSVHPRAYSFNNLKELLRSLRSRFDAAKEVVNIELGCFSRELEEIFQKADLLTSHESKMAQELLVLARQCIEMTSLDFRTKCETIVQDLTVKRQKCQAGLLKSLFTRILFILTRCTRLLHFEKDSGSVNERSLDKLRKCLEKVPFVGKNWTANGRFFDSDACTVFKKDDAKQLGKVPSVPFWEIESMPEEVVTQEKELANIILFVEQKGHQDLLHDHFSDGERIHELDGKSRMESAGRENENYSDASDLVICRICEELVPAVHLESHSYICAYAEKCVSNNLDVDERLLKLAELLERLLELRRSSNSETHVNPEISKIRTINSTLTSESYSPKFSEWRSKGIDGMLEDLHEMDTACIEDFNVANLMNLKSHLLMKVNQSGPPSSSASVTSTSSTNSPRAGNFDIFWLDQNTLSEHEDMQQIMDLVDIAHCVVRTDLSEEGSHDFLLACLKDLQETLQNSRCKALLVDTFGGRIESLLREKYILACDLVDTTIDAGLPENARSLLDSASQSSTTSTPSHSAYKERISIDDFDIIKPISRGAYGKVFLARKRTTGDLFAVKVLKKLDMLRKNDIDRILAERNILITVRNPFVVRFFYSFTSTDNLYLVMEYLNGGDLYSLLKKVGCLEETVARTYIAELVLALEYLHSLGIVHRDLKPDNILIAHDGHIKLTDFGLSKIGLMNCTNELSASDTAQSDMQNPDDQLKTDTEDSQQSAVGTPDYLAPEILLGTEHGYAVDWWSVGIILFELLTGIPPFTADHPEIIFENILNRKIPWPSVPTEMSYEAQDLIDRLLVHDPSRRMGAKGAIEVKAHSFFSGVDWNNLTLIKAAFVPQPDSVDDTSYFVSRYNPTGVVDEISIDSPSDGSGMRSSSGVEKMDECGDFAEFNSSPLDLSLMNFSFKNLSQLASINHDVLVQSGKDSSKCSSPSKGSNTPGS